MEIVDDVAPHVAAVLSSSWRICRQREARTEVRQIQSCHGPRTRVSSTKGAYTCVRSHVCH